jgi:hypothetical protein
MVQFGSSLRHHENCKGEHLKMHVLWRASHVYHIRISDNSALESLFLPNPVMYSALVCKAYLENVRSQSWPVVRSKEVWSRVEGGGKCD